MRTTLKKTTALGVVAMAVAACSFAFAQDDLDALLKDLESETPTVTPAPAPAAETPPAPAVEETPAPAPAPAVETPAPAPAAEAAAEETPAPEPAPAVAETPAPAPAPAPAASASDAELMSNIVTTERVRRQAFDVQAKREIDAARLAMRNGEYEESANHYTLANKLLNDRPATKGLRRECLQGIAEAYYRAALQERTIGRNARAQELMEKAVDMRHPKARRTLEDWKAESKTEEPKDISEIAHRRNETDYQKLRETNRKHLRRSRQLLSVRDLDGALEECEMVLVKDPYNEEAIRLRGAIQKKRQLILQNEFEVAREGMIADVDKAWRPVYAPNAREIEAVASSTVKKSLGEDPERAVEQTIIKRMKEMRLPTISFKPPATIIDAVEYFRGASKDFDRPDIPMEQRGFNFVLKMPKTLQAQAAASDGGESEEFGASGDEASQAPAGVPVIPMITASDISFYEALKLVCDSVNYKFKVQGSIVMVMDKDMTIDEMVTRSYPVLSTFMERMGSAASDMKEMKSAGFGAGSGANAKDEGEENQEKDWKAFFEEMGVQWPEGSSLMYIKAIGKLRVKNTYENLAELEKALAELNVDQKLIEIEARFIEVQQQDLNSLGFEWILNSDYAIGMDNWLGKALNMQGGMFKGSETKTDTLTGYDIITKTEGGTTTQTVTPKYTTTTTYNQTQGASWIKDVTKAASMGVNAFGGNSEYQNGMRYLSTEGNHISGTGKSTNDQFMRVNAFLGNADLSMILHMLSQRSDTDLLNAPKVLTKPGEEAVIKVVTEFIYPTDYNVQLQSSSSSGSSYGGSQSAVLAVVEPQSFQTREVGVILDVTPMLTDDGNLIDLKLNTQVVELEEWHNYGMRIPFTGNSSLQSFQGIGEIFTSLADLIATVGAEISSETQELIVESATASALNAMDQLSSSDSKNIQYYEAKMEQPFFHVRSIDSSVSIYPGATIVMGGLITEQRKAMDDKIPFLGDMPFVGRFFRSHAESTTKRNLLIFLTTRLVDARGREVSKDVGNTTDEADVKAAPEAKAE